MTMKYMNAFIVWYNRFFVETAFGRGCILYQLTFLTPLIIWMLYENKQHGEMIVSPIPFIASLTGYCGALLMLEHYERNKKLTSCENSIFFISSAMASITLIWSYVMFFLLQS